MDESKTQYRLWINQIPAKVTAKSGIVTVHDGVISKDTLAKYYHSRTPLALHFENAVAPQNATGLFSHLPVTAVGNGLDTWHTLNMNQVLANDSRLEDISGLQSWNVNNVMSFAGAFADDKKLVSLRPLAGWQTENGIDFSQMFTSDVNISDLNPLRNWNVSNATTIEQMFANTAFANADHPVKPMFNRWWFANNFVNDRNMIDGDGDTDSYYTPVLQKTSNGSYSFTGQVETSNDYHQQVAYAIPVIQVIYGVNRKTHQYHWFKNQVTFIKVKGQIGDAYSIPLADIEKPKSDVPMMLDKKLTTQEVADKAGNHFAVNADRASVILSAHGWVPFSSFPIDYNRLENENVYTECHGLEDTYDSDIGFAHSMSSKPNHGITDGWNGAFNQGKPNFCLVLRYYFYYFSNPDEAAEAIVADGNNDAVKDLTGDDDNAKD